MNYRVLCIILTMLLSTQTLLPAHSSRRVLPLTYTNAEAAPEITLPKNTMVLAAVISGACVFTVMASANYASRLFAAPLATQPAPLVPSSPCPMHCVSRLQVYAEACDNGICERTFDVQEVCEPKKSDTTLLKERIIKDCPAAHDITFVHDIITLCKKNKLPACMPVDEAIQVITATCNKTQPTSLERFNTKLAALKAKRTRRSQ